MATTYNEDGSMTKTITERQQQKNRKRNIKTPDNFNFGDMDAEYRKKYLQMLEQHNKK